MAFKWINFGSRRLAGEFLQRRVSISTSSSQPRLLSVVPDFGNRHSIINKGGKYFKDPIKKTLSFTYYCTINISDTQNIHTMDLTSLQSFLSSTKKCVDTAVTVSYTFV